MKQLEENSIQINYEVIRTKVFMEFVSQSLQEFNIGHIQLSEPLIAKTIIQPVWPLA